MRSTLNSAGTYRASWGFSLIEVLIGLAICGLLVVVGVRLLTNQAAGSRHLEMRGLLAQAHNYVQNRISCSRTLADQMDYCGNGRPIEMRDLAGRVLARRETPYKRFDDSVEVRATCAPRLGAVLIYPEMRQVTAKGVKTDSLTGKALDWHDVTRGVGFACPCVSWPSNEPAVPPLKASSGLFRSTVYLRNIAVDPGNTRLDKVTNYNLKPYPLSPKETLSETIFRFSDLWLGEMFSERDASALEITAHAAQFLYGLDRVGVDVKVIGAEATVESKPNIYSGYGYVVLRNLAKRDGLLVGDLGLGGFEAFTGGTALGTVEVQDGTDVKMPMWNASAPKKVLTQVRLADLEIRIRIYADSYDTVQYRTVRVNLWGPSPVGAVGC